MLIVDREDNGTGDGKTYCRIWLEERPAANFEMRLVGELLALARPVGLGEISAYARRNDDIGEIIADAMQQAPISFNGQEHWDRGHVYDYVAGYRIKVDYYPDGLPVFDGDPEEEADALRTANRGRPFICSSEFDHMYGEGALENAVRLALDG